MIARISSLLLVCCSISVVLLSFLRMRISSERNYLSISDLTSKAQKNLSCVLVMTISYYDIFLMAESSIWWVFLSNSTNVLCTWVLIIGFHVLITILDNPPGMNSEVHDHAPSSICFTLVICKDAYYSPWR